MQLECNRQSGVVTLWQGIAAWYRRDAIYRELAALDARDLKDIGITPADIPAIVEGRFWRCGGKSAGVDKTRDGDGTPSNHPVGCTATPP